MAEIIPAINSENISEIKDKLELIAPHTRWAHIDVADGSFTQNVLWHSPAELDDITSDLKLEVHLMLSDIDQKIIPWLAATSIKRIIFHIEAAINPDEVIAACKAAGKDVGISLKPETEAEKLQPYFSKVDLVQILAVSPGRAGQTFDERALNKISSVRAACPSCIIEVDGGMKIGTAKSAAAAGANAIVAASAIFNSSNIEEAIKTLQNDTLTRR